MGFLVEAFVDPFLVFCYHACRVFRGGLGVSGLGV